MQILFGMKRIHQMLLEWYEYVVINYKKDKIIINLLCKNRILNLYVPISQNGQTHSSNSSANCPRIV